MAESQNQGKNSGLPAGQVLDTCQRMIDCMRLDLTVTGSEEEGVLRINLTGADRPCLLSNSASLLNCLEYLLGRIYRGPGRRPPAYSWIRTGTGGTGRRS